ncbi:7TM-containing protein possibly involved in signal transduction [Bernardetia litoralis DSM 6794]|uniref:7TM-containing protein possibly involved in signal transduction n=1 Tax=Bernardetia litoralis (strain ATCC 23117 / DSM 6794 / NBRC 15988 / NCIMB 1366 / Fx l1 / Sio-4) TaxID=880071 RepID=I4AJ47_BERLS|nr:7TM diverse intracellular signaling domain-containing protein [Bernardetia litoralis]AFM03982.1 7TM-containing protein possibly involved in signal transduction [Bernardetia litoralis DSM 6794]
MKFFRLIFSCILIFTFNSAFSQKKQIETVNIDPAFDIMSKAVFDIKNEKIVHDNLLNDAFVYVDCSQEKSFQDIINLQNDFIRYSDTVTWNPSCIYWVKITINNTLPHEHEWVLNLGKDLNLVDVFDPLPALNQYSHKRNGIFISPAERNIDEIVSQTKVRVNFFPKSKKTLFIRYQNINNRPIKADLKLIKKDKFEQDVKYRNLSQGIFQGLIWIMVFYNFLIFILNKEKVYLYYSLYLLGTGLFLMVMSSLALDGVNGEVFHYIWYFAGLCVAFYFLFMRSFIRTDELFPKMDKAIKVAIYIQFLVVIFVMLYHFTKDIKLIAILYFLSIGLQALFILVLLVWLLVILNKKKTSEKINKKLMYFFIAGSFALIVGAATGNIMNFLDIAQRTVGGTFIQVGIVAEILLFSMGLGYRMKLNEKEKQNAQENLIIQLKENESLQRTLNQELEQKVQERTQEIEAQKEQINKKNHLLVKTNKKMTDSITYAARIQAAILGDIKHVEEELGDSFIFFRPRDIVSGDFYWLKKIKIEEKTYKIFVVADCTGHGVPGAFMTVMGVDSLEEIVSSEKIWQPHEILYKLDKRITAATTQRQTTGRQIRDGMDIVILVFEEGTDKAYFAGAKNPLFHIRGNEQLLTKGSMSAIGGTTRKEKSFVMHEITYQKGDIFYLYSDGFQDQFGGKKGLKYMSKIFRQKLLEISNFPIATQKEILDKEFVEWKGTQSQTDDVILAGIRM